jgi:tetratricopeptide (TPR) repeat protein
VQRGTNLYADGNYIEAAEVFERTENRLPNLEAPEQARYGLYRGLTLLVLGDLQGAHQWFSFARSVERKHPGALGHERIALLTRGEYELGARVRQSQRLPRPPANAVATTPQRTPSEAPDQGSLEPPVESRSLVP